MMMMMMTMIMMMMIIMITTITMMTMIMMIITTIIIITPITTLTTMTIYFPHSVQTRMLTIFVTGLAHYSFVLSSPHAALQDFLCVAPCASFGVNES